MNTNKGLFLAVAASDADRQDLSHLPLPVAVARVEDDRLVVALDGTALSIAEVYANLAGCVAFSDRASEELTGIATAWNARYGTDLPATLTLSSPAAEASGQVVSWVIDQMVAQRSEQARRNVQLQKDLSQLRSTHEATQTAFQRLEQFVYSLGGPRRFVRFQLEALPRRAPLTLEPGDRAEQRLPCDSAGLSDVAVYLAEKPKDTEGTIDLSLELLESGEIKGKWTIPAKDVTAGWLRCALGVCLGADRQTPVLRVNWHGNSPLKLSRTMSHPDTRFCAARNGVAQGFTMACAAWASVPETGLPLPAGAHTNETIYPRRWVVPTEMMSAATVDSPDGLVAFKEELGGLTVTPTSTGPCVARLVGGGSPGMRHLTCSVETKSETAPDIEYCLAIVPTLPKGRLMPSKADIEASIQSEWLRLPASHWAELHLILDTPIEQPCDICVMTRYAGETPKIPEEPQDVNCCFFEIRATA